MTPAPSTLGVPMIGPELNPVCQPIRPVAGSTSRSEPGYVVPPIVVPLLARYSCEPSYAAAEMQSPGPWLEALPIWSDHTGPAARSDVSNA